MGIVDKTSTQRTSYRYKDSPGGNVRMIENTISTAVPTAQVDNALTPPANTIVLDVFTQTVVASDKTHTATVGDTDTANGWDASVNCAAAAGTRTGSAKGTDAFALAGKVYDGTLTIDLTHTVTSGPSTAGSIRVQALIVDLDE